MHDILVGEVTYIYQVKKKKDTQSMKLGNSYEKLPRNLKFVYCMKELVRFYIENELFQ